MRRFAVWAGAVLLFDNFFLKLLEWFQTNVGAVAPRWVLGTILLLAVTGMVFIVWLNQE